MENLVNATPAELRAAFREEKLCRPTAGLCNGYAQGNLVILPKALAFDFLLFTQRNPKPCPVLEVTDVGSKEFRLTAKGSDVTTDLPLYRVYEHGVLTGEYQNIKSFWREDFVAFLLGCSFSFEGAMLAEGIPVRHIEEGCNVPMYITNIPCTDAGAFSGPMVCSMRPIPHHQVVKAVEVTGRFPRVHGSPVHIGSPEAIGIADINKPNFGEAVTIRQGETPVFWACGVTPQAVAMQVKPEIMITHAPGHMFITDIKDHQL